MPPTALHAGLHNSLLHSPSDAASHRCASQDSPPPRNSPAYRHSIHPSLRRCPRQLRRREHLLPAAEIVIEVDENELRRVCSAWIIAGKRTRKSLPGVMWLPDRFRSPDLRQNGGFRCSVPAGGREFRPRVRGPEIPAARVCWLACRLRLRAGVFPSTQPARHLSRAR